MIGMLLGLAFVLVLAAVGYARAARRQSEPLMPDGTTPPVRGRRGNNSAPGGGSEEPGTHAQDALYYTSNALPGGKGMNGDIRYEVECQFCKQRVGGDSAFDAIASITEHDRSHPRCANNERVWHGEPGDPARWSHIQRCYERVTSDRAILCDDHLNEYGNVLRQEGEEHYVATFEWATKKGA